MTEVIIMNNIELFRIIMSKTNSQYLIGFVGVFQNRHKLTQRRSRRLDVYTSIFNRYIKYIHVMHKDVSKLHDRN